MKNYMSSKNIRHPKAVVGPLQINQIHIRNPNIIMWWAAAFPGFGHIALSKYYFGFSLVFWEFYTNVKSNLNLSIYYSLLGNFNKAKENFDLHWFYIYIAIYLFSIWDARRIAIDLNKYTILAEREGISYSPIKITSFDINYLDVKNPYLAIIWSMFFPGLGHIYLNRIIPGLFGIFFWIFAGYFSKFPEAIYCTALGKFQSGINDLIIEWFLFLPSMYGFSLYDSYTNAIEHNELFKTEQAHYLKRNFQPSTFSLPNKIKKSEDKMQIIASFQHSKFLELAISDIEELGIPKNDIFAIPLKKKTQTKRTLKTIQGNTFNMFDKGFAYGTVLMVLGSIYGFKLKWGPIIWAMIGLLLGFAIGFVIDFIKNRKKFNPDKWGDKGTEVFIIVNCKKEQLNAVEEILWDNFALGISKV